MSRLALQRAVPSSIRGNFNARKLGHHKILRVRVRLGPRVVMRGPGHTTGTGRERETATKPTTYLEVMLWLRVGSRSPMMVQTLIRTEPGTRQCEAYGVRNLAVPAA